MDADLARFAYPLLLAAGYAIYRVGRPAARAHRALGIARVTILLALLGIVTAFQYVLVTAGAIRSAFGLLGAILGVASIVGLLGLCVLDARQRHDHGVPMTA